MTSKIDQTFISQEIESPIAVNKKQVDHDGRSYSTDSKELPNPEEVVRKVLESEKLEFDQYILRLEARNPILAKELKREDSYWQNRNEECLDIENWLRIPVKKSIPSWQVAGSLDYSMSLEQMKDVITKKFRDMALTGNLMTEDQLTKKYDRDIFYPPTGRGKENLTRIWGAEFLKSNLKDDNTLNAPEHFLIVDTDASEVEVEVWHGNEMSGGYPTASIVRNAHILAQCIKGYENAFNENVKSDNLKELQYRDLGDPGNIICDSNGVNWIVDTELKGFNPPELSVDSKFLQDYLKKRFEVLAGEKYHCFYQTFKISIANLSLK